MNTKLKQSCLLNSFIGLELVSKHFTGGPHHAEEGKKRKFRDILLTPFSMKTHLFS